MADTDPTANDRIISSLFESELHRPATAADLDYWGNQMKVDSQTNPETMKAAFAASYAKDNPNTATTVAIENGTDNAQVVRDLVKTYLHREATPGDIEFWTNRMSIDPNTNPTTMKEAFSSLYAKENPQQEEGGTKTDTTTTTTTDYKKIIGDMIKSRLHRDATEADYSYWTENMKANPGQAYIDQMGASMDELYKQQQAGGGTKTDTTTTDTTKTDTTTTTTDYKKIIGDMIKARLHRDATEADYSYWTDLMKANPGQAYIDQMGASMDELYKKQQAGGGTTTTLTDADYKKMIDRQILAKFGRPANQADYDLWLPTLQSGQYTEATLGDLYAKDPASKAVTGLTGFKNDPIDMSDAEKTRRYSPITETMFKPTEVDFTKLTAPTAPKAAVMGNPWAAGTDANGKPIPAVGAAPTYGVYTGTNKPATVTKSIGDLIESITPKTETSTAGTTAGTASNAATLNSGIAGLNPALNLDPNKTLNLNQNP